MLRVTCCTKLHYVEVRKTARVISAFKVTCALANVCDALHVCCCAQVDARCSAREAKQFHFVHCTFSVVCVTVVTDAFTRCVHCMLPPMHNIAASFPPR
jgi:hypothetical protein